MMRSSISPTGFRLTIALLWLAMTHFAADTVCGAAAPRPLREVIVVFKTHFDIGYTDLASNVVQRYRTGMIDDALKCVDDSRDLPPDQQFVWTIPGWPMAKVLEDWPGQNPERKARIVRALKEGRFVVHALPFTTHTELLEPEDLVRGLEYSARICRELGLPLPRDAKMTDVPCHSWFVPTLLKHAGVDFLHLGCNPASRSPQVPTLFWWVGGDGSRLLTMYSAAGYGTGLAPPKGWPHQTWLALIQTGDNHGPPRPDEVRALLDQARRELPGVKIRIGRMSDFADALLAEQPDLPVVRGDMPDTWIHGPMCDPDGARTARNVRPAIASAEFLATHLGMWAGQSPERREVISQAGEQSLLYGEHTWGGALGWVVRYSQKTEFPYGDAWKKDRAAGRFKRLEDSWAEHSAYIARAESLISPVLAADLDALAASVEAGSARVVVYNPLPWKRDGWVRAKRPVDGCVALRPADGRGRIPVRRDGAFIEFLAPAVPSMGHRTFVPVETPPSRTDLRIDRSRAMLENEFLRVTLDGGNGAVASVVDKRTGREWVGSAGGHKLGQFVYERFDAGQVADYVKAYVKIGADWAVTELGKPGLPPASEVPSVVRVPAGCDVELVANEVAAEGIMKSKSGPGMPFGVTTRVVLYSGQPCLDLAIALDGKPADPWPEAGWMALPVAVDGAPQFRLMRQASLIDPAQDVVPGANRFLFGVQGGAAVVDSKGRGLAFCPQDSPLISFDQPGCWKYALDFLPSRPVAYVNLFNNQWSTNFRLWNGGNWTSRVRIWALDGQRADDKRLVSRSLETRYPLLAGTARGEPGKAPLSGEGLGVSREGIMVSAFGANPSGAGRLLRLWEMAGQSGPVTVTLPKALGAKTARLVDLRGSPQGDPLPISRGKFKLQLQSFAPVSVILEP